MLIEDSTTEMRWHPKNKQYYIDKGYVFTKMGDSFIVKAKDLLPCSHAVVKVQCDFCGKILDVKMENYTHRGKLSDGYACKKCEWEKINQSIKNKYGVDNVFQLPYFQEKAKETMMEKYGVEHNSQMPNHQEKVKKTMMERYGVEYYTQSLEGKEKVKESNRKKYGVDYHTQLPESIEKIKQTQIERYGGIGMGSPVVSLKIKKSLKEHYGGNPMKNPEIVEKRNRTLYKKGNGPISKPQEQLHKLLIEIYGNSKLNYPCGRCLLDCVVEINGSLFDFEYDGNYWHKNTGQKDYQRDWYVKSQGYKIVRVKGDTGIPSKEQIIDTVNWMLSNNKNFAQIKLDI